MKFGQYATTHIDGQILVVALLSKFHKINIDATIKNKLKTDVKPLQTNFSLRMLSPRLALRQYSSFRNNSLPSAPLCNLLACVQGLAEGHRFP